MTIPERVRDISNFDDAALIRLAANFQRLETANWGADDERCDTLGAIQTNLACEMAGTEAVEFTGIAVKHRVAAAYHDWFIGENGDLPGDKLMRSVLSDAERLAMTLERLEAGPRVPPGAGFPSAAK